MITLFMITKMRTDSKVDFKFQDGAIQTFFMKTSHDERWTPEGEMQKIKALKPSYRFLAILPRQKTRLTKDNVFWVEYKSLDQSKTGACRSNQV